MSERSRSSPHTAVLRVSDQQRGRAPEHCVETGVATPSATKVTAVDLAGALWLQLLLGSGLTRVVGTMLRRPRQVVVLNVSERAWAIWRWRQFVAAGFGSVGVAVVVVGVVSGHAQRVVLGALIIVATVAWRAWMSWCWWVSVRLRATDGQVIVQRVSAAFDADARRLFGAAGRR